MSNMELLLQQLTNNTFSFLFLLFDTVTSGNIPFYNQTYGVIFVSQKDILKFTQKRSR